MNTHLLVAQDAVVALGTAAGDQGNHELVLELDCAVTTLKRALAALEGDGTLCAERAPRTGPGVSASGRRLVLVGGVR